MVSVSERLPRSLNLKRPERSALALGKIVRGNCVHTAPTRPLVQRCLQLCHLLSFACCDHLDIAIFGISDPSPQPERRGLSMDKPSKTDALHAPLDQVMTNHGAGLVLQKVADRSKEHRLKARKRCAANGGDYARLRYAPSAVST